MTELEITEAHRTVLVQHRNHALEKEKLVKWMDELSNHKKARISLLEEEIRRSQASVTQLKTEQSELDAFKTTTIKTVNGELQKILTEVVASLGLGSNVKVQLSFEDGVPRLFLPT